MKRYAKLFLIFAAISIICAGPVRASDTNILTQDVVETVDFTPTGNVVIARGGSRGSRSYSRPSRTYSKPKSTPKPSVTKQKTNTRTKDKSVTKQKTNTKPRKAKATKTKNNKKKEVAKRNQKNKKNKKKARRRLSKADKKLAAKAKKSGKYYKNKKDAMANFKARNKDKYQSRYKSKPATRPDHIPQTTSVGGVNVNINYNSTYGGYGYMHNGSWMFYNAMADVAMMSVLMSRQGYFIEEGRPMVVVRPWYTCFIDSL